MARYTQTLKDILARFNNNGGIDVSLTEVANELGRNRATIHAHLTRLVELGYLKKVEYGRYLITPAGKAALEARPIARSFIRCPDCGRKITT